MARNPDFDYFYEQTRAQIEHEDLLINHRLTWLFTLNGFLFTAFAFSLSAEATAWSKDGWIDFSNRIHYIRNCLAMAGVGSSFILLFGIVAASMSMRSLTKKCEHTIKDKKDDYPQVIGNIPHGMWLGLLPTWILPVIFCGIWLWLQWIPKN